MRCQALAQQLIAYTPDRFIASTEPKATETAQIAADLLNKPFATAENLHEHERATTGYLGREAFEQAVQHFFEMPAQLVFGEESADTAYTRFATAVHAQIEQYPDQNLAIVAHGTVISLFVARAAGVEPFPLWKRLGLPSLVVLDGSTFSVSKVIDTL